MEKNYVGAGSLTKRLTLTALLIAIAIIINMFRFTVPIAGASVMRVSFSGPFLHLVAILFGPVYGGIAGGLCDVISFLLKPEGGFLYPLTIVAILKGFSVGLIWNVVKDLSIRKYNVLYLSTFSIIGVIGFVNTCVLKFFQNNAYYDFLQSIGKKADYTSFWLLGIAIVGILVFMLIRVIYENANENLLQVFKILISVGIPSLVFTTVNTIIFQRYGFFGEKAFTLVLIPRLVEESVMILLNTYIMTVLLSTYEKVILKISR